MCRIILLLSIFFQSIHYDAYFWKVLLVFALMCLCMESRFLIYCLLIDGKWQVIKVFSISLSENEAFLRSIYTLHFECMFWQRNSMPFLNRGQYNCNNYMCSNCYIRKIFHIVILLYHIFLKSYINRIVTIKIVVMYLWKWIS